VYLHRKKSDYPYCYRTVRAVDGDNIKIYHLGQIITVQSGQIIKIVSKIESKIRGINTLSELMYQKGITNEDLADKTGYSTGTIDRARRGIRVKTRTLSDIWDTINQL
jgi:hypothetical protein